MRHIGYQGEETRLSGPSTVRTGSATVVIARNLAELSGERLHALDALDRAAAASSPFQQPWLRRALGDGGTGACHVAISVGDRIEAAGFAVESFAFGRRLRGPRILTFPKGPVLRSEEHMDACLEALRASARNFGVSMVEIEPQLADAAGAAFEERAAARGWEPDNSANAAITMRLDLTRPDGELYARMRANTRRLMLRAGDYGVEVREMRGHDDIAPLSAMFAATSARKGFEGLESTNVASISRELLVDPDAGTVLVAEHEGRMVGGIVVVRAGQGAHYTYGASDPAGERRNLPIAYPLQRHAIEWARRKGCRFYDLGGYDPSSQGGVALFKRGLRGDITTFPLRLCASLTPGAATVRQVARAAREALSRRGMRLPVPATGPRIS